MPASTKPLKVSCKLIHHDIPVYHAKASDNLST